MYKNKLSLNKNITLKRTSLILIFGLILGLSGCTKGVNPNHRLVQVPTQVKEPYFRKAMTKVAHSTQDDRRYNKITLDSKAKKLWFKNLMYRLWDRQITRNEFILEGLSKYPARKYEFTFVANGFQKL